MGESERELLPFGRFDWERLIERLHLSLELKAVAWRLAQTANQDGANVRPGIERIANGLERSERTVSLHIQTLEGLGLLELTRRGGGRGRDGYTNVYRLTSPGDGALPMRLDPDGRRLIPRPKGRRPIPGAANGPKRASAETPVDNSADPKPVSVGSDLVAQNEPKLASDENEFQPKPAADRTEAGDALSRSPLRTTKPDHPQTNKTRVVQLGEQLTSWAVDNRGAPPPGSGADPDYNAARDVLAALEPDDLDRLLAVAKNSLAVAKNSLAVGGCHHPSSRELVIRAAQLAADPDPNH